MAESKFHKGLVSRAAKAVRKALCSHRGFRCYVDGPVSSDGLPPSIEGYRPDVYATSKDIVVVGEAKPPWDVETNRSELQLGAFLHYVERGSRRHMVLAVHWSSCATAKSVLKSIAYDWMAVRSRVHILDGRHTLTLPSESEHYVTLK